ncbi:MAG: HIT family protein [Candidatus Liptonbacteria bacterium]|nr:HIT family protein [Candidatus Liptonbacteria bacterium]
MANCVFCKIAKKEIAAEVIYEDNETIAFLDIHPRAQGHAIVVPKTHRENILEAQNEELGPIFSAVKKVVSGISESISPDGFTIGINHGKFAGQEIDHLHIHIIPRFTGDGGRSIQSVADNKPSETIQETASKIKKAINK